jgi:hypothetical protein
MTASSTTILKELNTFLFGSEISRRSTYLTEFNISDGVQLLDCVGFRDF